MIPALTKTPARRLATVGLVALLFTGCAIPEVTPTPAPTPLATVAPTTPPYTLGPTMSPSPKGCPIAATASSSASSSPAASASASMSPPPALTGTATVKMTTNFGDIVIKVDSKLGPHAAGAFVALARCGYYNNIIFHRVVPTFIIQAGDGIYGRMPNPTLTHLLGTGGPGWTVPDDPITVPYTRGTIALANTGKADSGSSQFFIVLSDANELAKQPVAYAIFGTVTKGMDVVDRISMVPTGGAPDTAAGGAPSMPLEPVVITSTIVTTP